MISYVWPIALVVLANTFYHVFAKNIPETSNTFAVLTVTYLVGAAVSAAIFFITDKSGAPFKEFTKLNWAPFALGLAIIGLEAGYVFAYKVGWQVSTAQTVQGAFVAAILVAVGVIYYRESLTWNKIAGIAICISGIALINLK